MATKQQIQTLINTNLGDNTTITATEHRQVENALLDFAEAQWLTGDIKEVDCTNGYITANFDNTGLGINERVGWAICNGLNGTKDRNGRVGVAYGTAYPVMGATGGSKDAVVVTHSHTYSQYVQSGTNDGSGGEVAGYFTTGATSTVGESGTNKNMQPYIITLFIQKL